MASGLKVEPQALRDTGDKLKGLSDQAGGLVTKAAGAVVHPKSWGLVGMLTLYAQYASTLPEVDGHLHCLQAVLGAVGDKLKDAAQAYEEVEISFGASLSQLDGQLCESGPKYGEDGSRAAGTGHPASQRDVAELGAASFAQVGPR
ncbi:MAG: hypothetical protein ACXVXP_10780 [Mycobacteriaceae bacterium]